MAKTKQAVIPVLLLTLVVCAFAARAAAEDNLRLNVIVELARGQERVFDAAWMTVRDALAAAGYPFYTVVSESGARRHFVSVINDYESLVSVSEFQARVERSEDPSVAAALAALKGGLLSHRSYISRHDVLHSYAPPGSYSGPYHRLETFTYPLALKEELTAAFSALKKAWTAAAIPHAFHLIWHGLGESGSRVTMLTSAPSSAAHAARESSIRAATGDAQARFTETVWRIVSATERRFWLSRPELTLKPLQP